MRTNDSDGDADDMEDVDQSPDDARQTDARRFMEAFLARTGVTGAQGPVRYLWTDAFAVCNLFGLARRLEEPGYAELAVRLIADVHEVLGRHRPDDPRRGWISGLDEQEGRAHPTAGGLRIGKPLPERARGEADAGQLEWQRDGQYFHYLTRWAHALQTAAIHRGEPRYGAWARELMQAACEGFAKGQGDDARLVWKMSIELDRPQVSSSGHHDPLEGHVRCLELAAGAMAEGDRAVIEAMQRLAARLDRMIHRAALATPDPLGTGGLLMDTAVLARLVGDGRMADDGLLAAVLDAAAAGLDFLGREAETGRPAGERLAFRELGLAIGLHALPVVREAAAASPDAFAERRRLETQLADLAAFEPLGSAIESFWSEPGNRRNDLWREHEDINSVMLASALAPEGVLRLSPPPPR